MSKGSPKDYVLEAQASPLSFYDHILIDLVRKILVNDFEVIESYAKMMITVLVYLLPVYFSAISFISNILGKTLTSIYVSIIVVALLIISLIPFTLTIFPKKWRINPEDLSDIRELREEIVKRKYKYSLAGFILFLIGLILMAIQFLTIIFM